MIIKYHALKGHLQRNLHPLYILSGAELVLLNEAAQSIKQAWYQRGDTEETKLHIETPADWDRFKEEINSYSLFAEHLIVDARFDKKSIDSVGKEILTHYLKNSNPRCFIILHAHAVPLKQLQWLSAQENVVVVQIAALTSLALKNWITLQLKQQGLSHEPSIPDLILQYSQGNMLACTQVIEKLSLLCQDNLCLDDDTVRSQLIDQCEYQLYELADACLSTETAKCIHLLRQSHSNRVEPTLLLWLLTQEVRQLIQLNLLLQQKQTLAESCAQLKIWPQRTHLYEQTLKRLPLTELYQLLHDSKTIDEQIKTSQGHHIWHGLEKLAISLCLGLKK